MRLWEITLAAAILAGAALTASTDGGQAASVPVADPATALAVATSPPPTATVGVPVKSVRYDFGAGLRGEIWDLGHVLKLHEVSARGGRVSEVLRGDGVAVGYPAPCFGSVSMCPRVILQSDPAPGLNPDRGDVRWGARVMLAPGRTTDGENVVQKGFSTAGTQYKLQVDHYGGLASCVVAGYIGPLNKIYVAQWRRTVADGVWHSLDCVRHAGELTLTVDGRPRAAIAVPAELSIVNGDPLRLGGKGLGPYNDQFHGVLDDVYVAVG